MNAPQFWFAALALAGVAVCWTIAVLLLLNVHITTPFPAWLVPPSHEGVMTCVDAEMPRPGESGSAAAIERSCCPRCGAAGKRLGATKYAAWFYCARCESNPWPVLKDDEQRAGEAVA